MATSNFGYDEVLGIIACNTIDYEKEYEKENGKELSYDSIVWDWYWDDWKEDISELNKQLKVLNISLEAGHYESAMLRLNYCCSSIISNDNYLRDDELAMIIHNRYDKKALTKACKEIDCKYWEVYPSEIFKDWDIVVEWINDHLKNGALLNLGIEARFSNGETWYSRSNKLLSA